MTYNDFENIVSEFGLERIKECGGDCWHFRFKDIWVGRIHKTKKINRSILWVGGKTDILNHIPAEELREKWKNKIQMIKYDLVRNRLKNLGEDF